MVALQYLGTAFCIILTIHDAKKIIIVTVKKYGSRKTFLLPVYRR